MVIHEAESHNPQALPRDNFSTGFRDLGVEQSMEVLLSSGATLVSWMVEVSGIYSRGTEEDTAVLRRAPRNPCGVSPESVGNGYTECVWRAEPPLN